MNELLQQIEWQSYLDLVMTKLVDFLPTIAGALLTLILGWIIINRFIRVLHLFFQKADFEPTVETFIESFLGILLKIILLIIVASMLGVQTTSLVALMGAAGLAVGLALQGSLSNFAGGVLILIFKPFKAGDYIEAQGFGGTVQSIQIFNTILETPDRKKIILPNGNLSNDAMINYTAQTHRRVDFVFGIGYGDDIKKAREVLHDLIDQDSRILQGGDYEPQVVIGALGESSVDVWCRVWVKTDDYWDVFFAMNEKVKNAFDENGISIPFPQRDVHVYQMDKE